MKKSLLRSLFFIACVSFSSNTFSQGRVVINEFMAWSGCNTTSEFIELMNFGPGPMNIGCYIVTNGTYSVTIPPNTILQPKQYFVLSGQDILAQNCGNTDSAIHVDLNWTTCNCSNTPIPTTGDGFMQNGGSANEKVVLFDPNLNVVDAVSRNIPVSPSISITTPTLSGSCSSHTFDLDNLSISYENIGNSTGIDNSFARKVDGDCGWVKTTAISAHDANKTGSSSSATYNFSTLSASNCASATGSISINVSAADVNALFPMNYTLAFDADSNSIFTGSDSYLYGADSSAPSIDINNLAYGRYRITVGSSSSCNLKNFDFFIFNCYGVVLPVKLMSFSYDGIENNRYRFKFQLAEWNYLKEIVLEGSPGGIFVPIASLNGPFTGAETIVTASLSSFTSYRLRLKDQFDKVLYSEEIKISIPLSSSFRFWPNPVTNKLSMELSALERGMVTCTFFNSNGIKISEEELKLKQGNQIAFLNTTDFVKGTYTVCINGAILEKPISFLFIKE